MDVYDFLVYLRYMNVPDLLNNLHGAGNVDVLLDVLDLGNLDNSLHMLNLRNVNFNDLFLSNELWNVTHILDNLHWTWHVNLPMDMLYLRDLDNFFDVLNLWHMDMDDFLLNDSLWDMPDIFDHLNWAWYMHMALNDLHLWYLHNSFL
jgi:hypothetical protein